MMKERMMDWCVLRTAPSSTLRLAATLAEAGFEVWTPSAVQTRLVPRSKKKKECQVPILPTFVFARAARLQDLVRLAASKSDATVSFSIFRYGHGIPLISDFDLAALRQAERRAIPRNKRRSFAPGDAVRVPEGSFRGLTGLVEKSEGQFTLVCFPDWRVPVKIGTSLLEPDQANSSPNSGVRAKAA